MAGSARTIAAVAGGYLLGRTKKMQLALMLAALLAAKKAAGNGEGLTSRLDDLVSTTPGLSDLTEEIRGDPTQAVRATNATSATAVQKVTQASDDLQGSANAIRARPGMRPQDRLTKDQDDGGEDPGTTLLRGLQSGSGARPGSKEQEQKHQG